MSAKVVDEEKKKKEKKPVHATKGVLTASMQLTVSLPAMGIVSLKSIVSVPNEPSLFLKRTIIKPPCNCELMKGILAGLKYQSSTQSLTPPIPEWYAAMTPTQRADEIMAARCMSDVP